MSNDAMQDNFNVAAELDAGAAVKIQAVIRCLQDNTQTRIRLKDPAPGGRTVSFELISGDEVDLDDCCDLRSVTRQGDRLQA